MRRIKYNIVLVMFLSIGIISLGFISWGSASEENGRVSIRHIDDWLENNVGAGFQIISEEYLFNIGAPIFHSDYPKNYHGVDIRGLLNDTLLAVEGDTFYTGFVQERALNDGNVEYIIHLQVKNAPLTVYDANIIYNYILQVFFAPDPQSVPKPIAFLGAFEDGYIDYSMELVFILPESVVEIPSLWNLMLWAEFPRSRFSAKGYGTITATGTDARVTINEVDNTKWRTLHWDDGGLDHPHWYFPSEVYMIKEFPNT